MKDNGFKLTKKRTRRYSAQTITDADYANDIALLANTPAQARTLLHSLGRAAAGIGLHVNAHKTEYMRFNQRGDISTLNGSGQVHLPREQCLINRDRRDFQRHGRLSIGYRSYGSQTQFFPSSNRIDTAIWMHYMDANKTYGEKA